MPVDEMTLLKAQNRANKAKQLLEDELFNEAITSIERDLTAAWKATPPRDTDGRERCWTAIQQLGKIKGYFESVLNDGKMAAAELKALAESAERKRFFNR